MVKEPSSYQRKANKGVMVFEDGVLSRKLKCCICGSIFSLRGSVSEHATGTGHNLFDVVIQ